MRYLHRQAKRRKDPRINVPESLAVVVLLENYYWPDAEPDLTAPRVAKYARGEDYHRVTLGRLDRLADWLRQRGARVAHPYVDDGPIPERELAQRAGLGWIGKNTMLDPAGCGLVLFHRNDLYRPGAARRPAVHDRPLRQLHPVPRRVPDGGVRRAARARRDPLHLLPYDRAA